MTAATSIQKLLELGQSIWLDYVRRDLVEGGELKRMIEHDGLRGITSNPSIFEKAIAESTLYDDAIKTALAQNPSQSDEELFFRLAIEDVRAACDQFAPVYQNSDHSDGLVSLEVSPDLANDTDATIREAKALWRQVDRPNLMIKVPATLEGLPAINELLFAGINVNVTLLFSVERYESVLAAWFEALEMRVDAGLSLTDINSVASFFVSRVDTKVDAALEANGSPEALAVKGHAAVANAKVAYAHFRKQMESKRWERLASAGAKPQRLLWASTSTKNPAYPPLLYVETLIGPHTVNTLPPATYKKLLEVPPDSLDISIDRDLDEARALLSRLPEFGISLNTITQTLEREGVDAFSQAIHALLTRLKERRAALLGGA